MLFLEIIWYLYSRVYSALWPPGAGCLVMGCFQASCWELSLAEDTILQALCLPEDEERMYMKDNELDLSMCIGVFDGGLIWQDGGEYQTMAKDMYITHTDQFKEAAHIFLKAKCKTGKPDEYFPCEIDLSERIWIDDARIGCFGHAAEYKTPYFPFEGHGRREDVGGELIMPEDDQERPQPMLSPKRRSLLGEMFGHERRSTARAPRSGLDIVGRGL